MNEEKEIKDEGLIKDAYELILKEVQLFITVMYIVMIGIGMMFNYHRFSAFDINIFEYASVFDFMICPFQDRMILLFSFLAFILPILTYRVDIWWSRNYPRLYKYLSFGWSQYSWYNKFRYGAAGLVFLSALFNLSITYGQHYPKVVANKTPVTINFIDGSEISGREIGATQGWYFLLTSNDEVRAIPTTANVKYIQNELVNSSAE